MVVVLSAMGFLDVPLKWIIVAGFFLAVGILSALIAEIATRLDAGRSYIEQWTSETEELLYRR